MNDIGELRRAAEPEDRNIEPFSFTGTGREYFGIWIVNILLTILTLGIYSAWAKVRRQRYFYGNTQLAGRSFDYHARPMQILIGRIVVIAAFVAYNLLAMVFPLASLILPFLLLPVVPYLIKRGLRFNARVTSYRNVHLDFHGGYWGAFRAYLVGPFIAAISLGILAPVASRWSWRYTLENLSYGGRRFTCAPRLRTLYRQWWFPALIVLAGLVLLFVVLLVGAVIVGLVIAGQDRPGTVPPIGPQIVTVASMIMFALIYGMAGLFYHAGVRNVAFNATVLDGRHEFSSRLGRRRYAWIAISNFLLTVVTLGFARPWAAVRMARYVASATALAVSGALDDFLNKVEDSGPAIGAEYMDLEGVSFGF